MSRQYLMPCPVQLIKDAQAVTLAPPPRSNTLPPVQLSFMLLRKETASSYLEIGELRTVSVPRRGHLQCLLRQGVGLGQVRAAWHHAPSRIRLPPSEGMSRVAAPRK